MRQKKTPMRKSVFTEFICLCAAVFTSAIICVCAILIVAAEGNYKSDIFDFLEKRFAVTLDAVRFSAEKNGGIDEKELLTVLAPISDSMGADITLIDSDGVALVCSEASPCSHTDKRIGKKTLERITENGLKELSSLDGFYDGEYFIYAVKIPIGGKDCCLLTKMRDNHLARHMLVMLTAVVISAAVILVVVFTVLYTATKRLLTPIKDMTIAVERFAAGDFSKKLHVSDENELGYLASALNEMASSLEHTEETRKSFISNVSHELKTPMTTIGGFIDGILDRTIPKEQQEHYLKIVSAEIGRLSRLVRSMLNISKYEAGELKLSTEDFDILPIIVRTLMSFENRIHEKNVDIRGLDRGAFRVNADPDLTGQVVYNLVENAVKFVDKNGYIRFSFSENDDMRSVSIANSGDGLNENEISRVFDRFYKTDESRGIDPGGVGLGLSIVSSIIKLHDGTILVKSEPKQFTEFTFSLKKAVNDRR